MESFFDYLSWSALIFNLINLESLGETSGHACKDDDSISVMLTNRCPVFIVDRVTFWAEDPGMDEREETGRVLACIQDSLLPG